MEITNKCNNLKGWTDIPPSCSCDNSETSNPNLTILYDKKTDRIEVSINRVRHIIESDDLIEWFEDNNIVFDYKLNIEEEILKLINSRK